MQLKKNILSFYPETFGSTERHNAIVSPIKYCLIAKKSLTDRKSKTFFLLSCLVDFNNSTHAQGTSPVHMKRVGVKRFYV